MKIIPADKPIAAWNVGEILSDLLFWAIHASPEPLSDAWLNTYKEKLVSVTDAASRSFADDPVTLQKLIDVRRLGFKFATLLCDRPALSTIPIEEWTVPKYRRLFNDLDTLQAHFQDAGKEVIAPATITEAANDLGGRILEAMTVASTPADGGKPTKATISQGAFVYNGKTVDCIQPAPWRLLNFMEGKTEADLEEAYRHAINDNQKDSTDSAIKSMVRKANAALEAVSHPSRLSKPKNVSKIVWA